MARALEIVKARYPRVTDEEMVLVLAHFEDLVNTGAGNGQAGLDHVMDLLNDFRRPENRDLTVNVVRYLLGYGIDCQIRVLSRALARGSVRHQEA